MSDEKIDVVAIISPKKGKVDHVLGLLAQLADDVHDNEPMAIRYQAHREMNSQGGGEEIVMIEQYENMAAWDQHQKSEGFLDFARRLKEEDLLAKPIVLKVVRPVVGFASRL